MKQKIWNEIKGLMELLWVLFILASIFLPGALDYWLPSEAGNMWGQ